MIKPLTSLRFVFALMIFMHHYSIKKGSSEVLFPEGFLGVTFFFILSGFILSYTYWDRISGGTVSIGDFLKRRIFKLYPLHLLCLVIASIISRSSHILEIVPNVLLLQSWIPLKEYYFSGNAVSWCLSDEMFFYLVFPFFILFFNRHSLKSELLGLGIVLMFYICLIQLIPNSYTHALFYINPLLRSLDFVIGILLFRIYKRWIVNDKINSYGSIFINILEFTSIVLLFLMILISPTIPEQYKYASYYWLPMCIMIISFSYTSHNKKSGGIISHILSYPLFVKLGEVSFCFYMIHTICITVCNGIFNRIGFITDWYFRLPIILIITIYLSILCYSHFEKPVSKWLNSKL